MARQRRLPSISLRKAFCTKLLLHFAVPLEGAERLGELVQEEKSSFLVITGTRKSRRAYFGNLHENKKDEQYLVQIVVDFEPPAGLKGYGQAGPLLDALASLEARPLDAHCTAEFEYPSAYATSVLQIPFRGLVQRPESFDEIRGFRAVKLNEAGEVVYSVIVDSGDLKTIDHSVSFAPKIELDGSFLPATLAQARKISAQFFMERTAR